MPYVIKSLKTGNTYLRLQEYGWDWCMENEGADQFNTKAQAQWVVGYLDSELVEVVYVKPIQQFEKFMGFIGIKCEGMLHPLYNVSLDSQFDPDNDEAPGYIKFQSDLWSGKENETDYAAECNKRQAGMFEAWLKRKGFSYFRGYPSDSDANEDRRFFLGLEATKAIEEILLEFVREEVLEEV
jgi:hypothetical protein